MSEKVMRISIPEGSKFRKVEVTEVAEKPAEGKWFEVNPSAIDQQLFKKNRKDWRQEATRKLIQEAFTIVKENPEKYGKPFQTMMPKKEWSSKTVVELEKLAESLGDQIADWVHQSLEWAQRIANGESWETICNEPDTANWYRLVLWNNGHACLVGGSRKVNDHAPASRGVLYHYHTSNCFDDTVPLVVLYKK